eukprot:CAMPEP_0170193200 /NCGR_PEP_ID=MMETSP0040_2-20121228/56363_1 /TAXON_ID=641309 /ORGANISM="Lotharella oceanica, Strain CCMP622" /LENGTH=362 /DNA_ID=CAMNT_0010441781 /DNA_START=43 /DNA_END=1131 /DNA_ORIENTATION=-
MKHYEALKGDYDEEAVKARIAMEYEAYARERTAAKAATGVHGAAQPDVQGNGSIPVGLSPPTMLEPQQSMEVPSYLDETARTLSEPVQPGPCPMSRCKSEDDSKKEVFDTVFGSMKVQRTYADGNCLFRATAKQLITRHGFKASWEGEKGVNHLHWVLRRVVRNYVDKKWVELKAEGKLIEYEVDNEGKTEEQLKTAVLTDIGENCKWGGELALLILARCLKKNLFVFDHVKNNLGGTDDPNVAPERFQIEPKAGPGPFRIVHKDYTNRLIMYSKTARTWVQKLYITSDPSRLWRKIRLPSKARPGDEVVFWGAACEPPYWGDNSGAIVSIAAFRRELEKGDDGDEKRVFGDDDDDDDQSSY